MAATVTQDSDLAIQLQNLVQPKLVEAGWSAGDSTLAEYIVLMLVNGKDKDQVASELANDLLGLSPEDDSTKEFAQWLFDQIATLSGQGSSAPAQIPTVEEAAADQNFAAGTASDADMGSGMDVEQSQSIPTGPRSMRNGSNNRGGSGRRVLGHADRAMNRANDSVLHKVRNNSTERIGRHPPRGPRGGMLGNQFKGAGGIGRGHNFNPSGSQQQQQQQLMQLMNQSQEFIERMQMMQQLWTGGSPQASPGMMETNGAAVNPNFRGRSLADRINGGQRGGGKFGGDRKGSQQSNQSQKNNGSASGTASGGDAEMGTDASMETDSINTNNQPDAEKTVCRFNLRCTKSDCPFAHQSPAAPPGTTVDLNDTCTFGAACQNRKCTAKHPSPAKRAQFQAEQECKFWPNCTNTHCPFKHPSMPMCRFGGDCNKEDCKFTHVRTLCKYNPCMNPHCYFKHAEGQKRDSKWVKDKDTDVNMAAEHVSERKFVDENATGAEELIKPDGEQSAVATAVASDTPTAASAAPAADVIT